MIVVCIFINEIDYFKRWAIKLKASKSFFIKSFEFLAPWIRARDQRILILRHPPPSHIMTDVCKCWGNSQRSIGMVSDFLKKNMIIAIFI